MKLPRFEDFAGSFAQDEWLDFAKNVCRRHNISFDRIARAAPAENIIFLVDDKFIVKIYNPLRNGQPRERIALENARTSLRIPETVAFGELENYKYLVTTQLRGEQLARDRWLALARREQVAILEQLAGGLRELHRSDSSPIDFDWNRFIEHQAATCFERQKACGVGVRALAEIPAYLEENRRLLPFVDRPVFLHGDVHFGNIRFTKTAAGWEISGLFDFADSLRGFFEYDLLAIGVLMIQGQGDLQREFFRAFGYRENEIGDELRKRLMLLTMFYECSDLRRYALRLRPEAVDYSLLELERAIWNF